jgi:hypothetical protein
MSDIHSALYHSLEEALHHPNSASSAWLENPLITKGQVHVEQSNVNTGYWMDDVMEPLTITFPATLNLNGIHNNLTSSFIEENQNLVR